MKTIINISLITLLAVNIMFAQFPPDDKNWEVVFIDNFDSVSTSRCNIVHINDNGYVIALALSAHISHWRVDSSLLID